MARQRQGENLDGWLEEVEEHGSAELRSFAQGLRKEYQSVKAGLTLAWSNGPTEAQIQRLKLLKRQMYGQAGFTLLRQRVLHREEKLQTKPRKRKPKLPVAA
jgi:transposase